MTMNRFHVLKKSFLSHLLHHSDQTDSKRLLTTTLYSFIYIKYDYYQQHLPAVLSAISIYQMDTLKLAEFPG